MSELTNESSAQAAGTCPQTSTTGQGPGRSMEFLPVFDFEQRPYPNSAEQNHEEDVIDTELRSSIVPVPRPQSLSDDYDETPRSWTWAFEKLTKLVTDTRGEATEKVVKFVSKYLLGTKLIFVVGKAGTGKTTILSELTGLSGLEPEHSTNMGTKEYYICPAIIDDEQYLFIDTAGFGDPNCNDLDTFRNIFSCMIALGSFVQIVGVFFVIGKPGTRLDQQDAKTLRWVQCFCGPDFFRNVTFVTSFWDSYSARYFAQAYDTMQSLLADSIIRQVLHPVKRYHGAYVYFHGVTGGELTPESYPGLPLNESAAERRNELCNLVRRRYAELKFKPVKLQFATEIENNVSFLDTEAAKVLRAPAVGTSVEIVDGKCVVHSPEELPSATAAPSATASDAQSPTWRETIYKWYEVTIKLARYYREARQQTSPSASGVQNAWESIRAWWSAGSNTS